MRKLKLKREIKKPISISLNKIQLARLDNYAAAEGLTRSEYIVKELKLDPEVIKHV